MHLRMTGNLLWVAADDESPGRPHLRVRLVLDDGSRLLFIDLRRFGTGIVIDGRDELDAVPGRAARARSRSTRASRPRCSRAGGARPQGAGEGVPARPAPRRRRRQHLRGRGAVPRADPSAAAGRAAAPRGDRAAARRRSSRRSRRASQRQGASIDHYRDANGERGSMQDEFLVHLREGKPCPRCGRPIVKMRRRGPRHLRLPPLPAGAARRRDRARMSDASARRLRGRPLDRPEARDRLHRRAAAARRRGRLGRRPGRRPGHARDRPARPARERRARARDPADRRQRVRPRRRGRRRALAGARRARLRDPGRPRAARPGARSSTT